MEGEQEMKPSAELARNPCCWMGAGGGGLASKGGFGGGGEGEAWCIFRH